MSDVPRAARALPQPSLPALLDHVSVTPLLPVAVGLAAGWYAWRVRAVVRTEASWPLRRSVAFGAGLALVLWTGCGGLQAFAPSVFWIWTTQLLTLLLVAPVLLVAGQPVELARNTGSTALVRLAENRVIRFVSSPFIGPAVIPLLSAVLFFGPVPGWAIEAPPIGWLLQLTVVVPGCLIVLPLLDVRELRASLVVGLALAIGFVELLLDAVPGIVLRLETHLSSTFAGHRVHQAWTGSALHDQQIAGAVLWSVAELLDVPFLILLFIRWTRVDAGEASTIDSALDTATTTGPVADQPWLLADPQLRARFERDS